MKVTVVGGGVIGITTAWYLAEAGHAVTVVDRAPAMADETSHANGGLLHASHAEPWNGPGVFWDLIRWIGRENSPLLVRPRAVPGLIRWGLGFLRYSRRRHHEHSLAVNARLAVHSLERLRALRAETGLRYDDRQEGILKVFNDRTAFESAVQASTLMAEAGVRYQVLDPDQTVALDPAYGDARAQLAGAIYYPEDESGDACLFTRRLAALAAERHGVSLLNDTAVEDWRLEAGRIVAARTNRGEIEADAWVLAAGSYTPLLTRPLGLRVPIYPVKGYSVTLHTPDWEGAPRIPMIDDERKVVMARLGDRIRMAGTAEFAGYDLSLRPARCDNVLNNVLATFPGLRDHIAPETREDWCGLRPMSMDGPPIIGATPVPNLYLNSGTGHLGWTFACGVSHLLAQQLSGEPPALDMAPLALSRFN
ncbi:D-amino acid dehydrogenase [Alkalilimnicola ehrlichii MLHE-1]|uniref:D-amino acid dehydrogenase small subunit n=1 Tax=Alkalilimnicola ehrlichii (strain ATCC BAA-1101 / DSM 17681 / MLHE-1) TaxID=187272 RepID=Q0ABL8_ALKEH|nr:D-amino acid dehydrogenase [Alkalilimnicola ehrlichii]ABI55769.1 D-amino acid dehydrogenase small subunit [Alkalilimnicola ehrlichii MLHE-1]